MTEKASGKTPGCAKAILGLLGYVSLFAVPAVVLSLLFPSYAIWIVLTAALSILAVGGFLVGLSWDSPEWTDEARSGIKQVLSGITHIHPPPEEYSHGRGWVWYLNCVAIVVAMAVVCSLLYGKSVPERVQDYLVPAAVVCVLTVPAFFLGRTVYRWEKRRRQSALNRNPHQPDDHFL